MSLRILMMATGEFALPAFDALRSSQHDVVGLVTQPDRTGRGHHRHVNRLKAIAQQHGIEVFQPPNVNADDSLDELRNFDADLFVVAAYGQILSRRLLEIPPQGAINLHASLLPDYRGAAPIQYAIWNGETETGVTVFRIEPKLDAGPTLDAESLTIGEGETAGELETRLADLAAPLTLRVVDAIAAGTVEERPQPADCPTPAPRLRKEQGRLDFSQTAKRVCNQVRAMQPWPKAFTFVELENRAEPLRVVVLRAHPVSADVRAGDPPAEPGSVIAADDRVLVQCSDGPVSLERLQPAGKRAMTAKDFLRGHRVKRSKIDR